MPSYRAYLINGDNRVSSYRPIDADTDAEALKAARQFADGCDVEVWHLDRKIGRLERRKMSGQASCLCVHNSETDAKVRNDR